MVSFAPHEVPIAYSMIEAAEKLDPKHDWYHPFHRYFYYWAAFNNIYTTIAFTASRTTALKMLQGGSVETKKNGNVEIPKIKIVSEHEQIELAIVEFGEELKQNLILSPETKFFVYRTPVWHDTPIATDKKGQRLNGVLNINYTVGAEYPVWSPIDIQIYEQYLKNVEDTQLRDFLTTQIVEMLYTIRCNLMHGGKQPDDRNDTEVVSRALPLLEAVVNAFTKR